MNKINEAYSRAVEQYRVTVPLIGSEWADNNFYLSPESSGTEGKWKTYPYQIAILNWMTSDDIEEINWMKSRRVGFTKCLLAAAGCLIEQKNRNIAIWQPTDGDAHDFVTDEVDTMLRDVPLLGEKLRCEVGAKSKYNTLEKKVFHGATLDIKGGKSARNYRRMTKDVAIYDETDGFDVDIDGEGSCFELGDGRLDQAPFPKSIRGSTPKIKGLSLIESAVEKSEKVFYRYVKCPHCGVLQRLEFSQLKWENNDPSTTCYVCKHNGCVIFYKDYAGMDESGRWQTIDGEYYSDSDDCFYGPDNIRIEKPRRIGAKIWAGYSYLRPWSYVVDKWIAASREARNGNVTSLKAVINTLLGETWEEHGESVDFSAVNEKQEDYHFSTGIPNGVLLITAGIDCQGGANARVEIEVLGHGFDFETWSIDYVVIQGNIEEQSVQDHIDDVFERRFTRMDGVELGIAGGFIDSGYNTTEVYKFTSTRRNRKIYATKGVNTGTACNKGSWQGDVKSRSRTILHTCNVDEIKDTLFRRLKFEEKTGPGVCHFPNHYGEKYFQQLTNEEKKEKKKSGRVVGYEWKIKKEHVGNEPLDCRSYNMACLEKLNPNMPARKIYLDSLASAVKEKAKPPDITRRRSARSQGVV